ncbi:N-acetyltransferase family protein [Aestuariibius insulae]|uniref:GNAT family N-acetyltransferase n=1 Tax=Aestuariibius insulae TaxID=2058287 RepID=UPI00345EEA99
MTDLEVRPMKESDIPTLLEFFNAIVAEGGTTAHEDPFSTADFHDHYFTQPAFAFVVLTGSTPVGFQAVFEREPGLYSIGSFTDQRSRVKGAGAALFEATKAACTAAGGHTIIAKIRADNVPGLAYYSKMGFVDTDRIKGVPLNDGTPMDRIVKSLPLQS